MCDAAGMPLSLRLTGGNTSDTTELEAVLAGVRVPRRIGRPRTTPDRVIADKGYSSRRNRLPLARRGIKVTMPERDDQKGNRRRRGSAGGRPYSFDSEIYKSRNVRLPVARTGRVGPAVAGSWLAGGGEGSP